MTQSIIDICNSALSRLGAASILSLDDNSPEARACSLSYDSNRRAELRKRRWSFAIKRTVLAPDTLAPAFDFAYAFTLPSDCLRVLRQNTPDLDWVVEGRKILTNDSNTLQLRYMADVEDPAQFDPAFYDVVAIGLAVDICEKITQSTTKRQGLEQDYKDAVKDAARANSFENGPDDPPEDDWVLARL